MGCGASSQSSSLSFKASDFIEGRSLGDGASCQVFVVTEKATQRRYAMKKLIKCAGRDDEDNKEMFQTECKMLKKVRHEHILEIVESWYDAKFYYILTTMCLGGELFDRIVDEKFNFTEKSAAALTREIVTAVGHCHSVSVVHRDLKPENFVFKTKAMDSPITLIDFGCAYELKDNETIDHVAGTCLYMSPEVVRAFLASEGASGKTPAISGAQWKASDVWSIGVIVYILLTGRPPFDVSNEDLKPILGTFSFPSNEDAPMSDSLKDLITQCLQPDWKKRPSCAKILEHPWVKGETASTTKLSKKLLSAISGFSAQNKLRKAVGKVLANRMTDADKEALEAIFKEFDVNGDGVLSPEEIVTMMKKVGMSAGDAQRLAKDLDEDGDGNVQAKELMSVHALSKMKDDKQVFKMFDKDGDGVVTTAEILAVCDFLTGDQVQEIMKQADSDSDGKLGFDEWVKAMGQMKR